MYKAACAACHAAGAAGAPKTGDAGAWTARFKQGFDTLVKHAVEGFKGMPAKGGNPDLDPIMYVEALVGAETVDTIPLATVEAYLAAGQPKAVLPGATHKKPDVHPKIYTSPCRSLSPP